MEIVFKQDIVAQAVALLIEQNPQGLRGNATPLLAALVKAVQKAKQFEILGQRGWPKEKVWLGRRLRRSASVLRKAAGIKIEFGVDLRPDEGKDGIDIRRVDPRVGEYGEHGE